MKRQLTNPNKDTTIVNTLQVYEGGTGATTVAQAQINLDILPASRLGQPGGPAMLPLSGSLSGGMFEGGVDLSATLSGPVSVMVSSTNTYLITNYDVKTTYVVTATGGSVTVAGDTITYIANSVVEVGTITINGKVFEIPKIDQVPATPVVTSPVDNAVDVGSSVVYTASAFSTQKVGDTHANSDWEVASDSGFMTIVASSYADATNKTSWSATGLSAGTTYYARVRYRSSSGKASGWSSTKVFSTKATFDISGEQAKLVAGDLALDDAFGWSVSLSSDGSTAIVGASGKNSGVGAAYIFTRTGTTWSQQRRINVAGGGIGQDSFGASVSLSSDGNTAIIGAPAKTSSTGSAYVFVRSGPIWSLQQELRGSDSVSGDYFGGSVSISKDGNNVIISAMYKANGGTARGVAYIFTRIGNLWNSTEQAKIFPSDTANNDYFGHSVSISSDGNTAIACSHQKYAAYVFIRSGTTWSEQAKLVASDQSTGNSFGMSASISDDGNIALIGASNQVSNPSVTSGAAYIFTRSGTTWTQQWKLIPSDPWNGDSFGHSVSLSSDGSSAVVGSYQKNSSTGAIYVFKRSGTTWSQQAKLTASDATTYDYFGYSVGISGDGYTVIVGAYQESPSNITRAGSAYVFA